MSLLPQTSNLTPHLQMLTRINILFHFLLLPPPGDVGQLSLFGVPRTTWICSYAAVKFFYSRLSHKKLSLRVSSILSTVQVLLLNSPSLASTSEGEKPRSCRDRYVRMLWETEHQLYHDTLRYVNCSGRRSVYCAAVLDDTTSTANVK